MKNLLLLFFAALIALTNSSCNKEDKLDPGIKPNTVELTEKLNKIYTDSEVPGFAISIVKEDEVLYQKAFGKRDLENDQSYTNQTIQSVASITKTFVAAAVVKSIEQGYMTLETNINDVLPFEIVNPKNTDGVIKVKHLVSHTSGLIDNFGVYLQAFHILPGEDLSTPGAQLIQNGFGVSQRASIPLGDLLASYFLQGGALYSEDNFAPTTPGANWSYSNMGTSLAAYLVEVTTGQSFKDYVKEEILFPLNMRSTAFDYADLTSNNQAKLYWDMETSLPRYKDDAYPAGGIKTNNEDLVKFLIDMMKGVQGQSQLLFSKESYDLLFRASLPNGAIPPQIGDNQAVFWILKDDIIGHSGGDPGTSCEIQFDETGESGFLLITNMDGVSPEHGEAYTIMKEEIQAAIMEFIEAN